MLKTTVFLSTASWFCSCANKKDFAYEYDNLYYGTPFTNSGYMPKPNGKDLG